MKVYQKLLQKGITCQEELDRALYSISHCKDQEERDEAEWECILDFASNRGWI